MKRTLTDRLLAKCTMPSLFDCWIWEGATVVSRSGARYGKVQVAGFSKLAHRMIYEIFVGPLIGEGDHTCKETLCINPSHLRDTTHIENCANRRNVNQYTYAPNDGVDLLETYA